MTFKYRYRKQIIIGLIIFLILIGSGTYIFFTIDRKEEISTTKEENKLKKKEEKKEEQTKKEEKEEEEYSVDIKGQVVVPGIYTLKKSSRVIDVIQKAGGLTENADTSVINLSKKIEDEMVIIIYSREEVANFKQTKEMEKYLQEKCLEKDENALTNNACISNENKSFEKVNINTATLEELTTVSGIGEKKAQDIIKYREEKGGFKSIEEIKNISGIGDAIFDKIKESITV